MTAVATEDDVLRAGSLFTGYAGLDLALRMLFPDVELAWVSDIDSGPCKVLDHRFPDVPNIGDITKVDWEEIVRLYGTIHILTGGFPCQDLSHAGNQAGLAEGTRSGLWLMFAEAIRRLRPGLVLIENVRGLLAAKADRGDDAAPIEPDPFYDFLEESSGEDDEDPDGDGWDVVGSDDPDVGGAVRPGPVLLRALGAVLGSLADIGYDGGWFGVRAADPEVGAPHGRFRVFILAWPATDTEDAHGWRRRLGLAPAGAGSRRAEPGRRDPAADPESDRRDEGRPEPARLVGGPDAAERGAAVPDTDGAGRGEHRRPVAVPAEHPAPERDGDDSAPHPGGERHGGGEDGRALGRVDSEDEGRPRERGRAVAGDRGAAPRRAGARRGRAAADTEEREQGEPARDDRDPAVVGARPRAGRGDRAGAAAPGVPVVGRGAGEERGDAPGRGDAAAPDAGDDGRRRGTQLDVVEAGRVDSAAGGHPDRLGVAAGRTQSWGAYAPAIRRWERAIGRVAPSPTQPSTPTQSRVRDAALALGCDGYAAHAAIAAGVWAPRLNPEFVEWMMGLPAGWVTDVPSLTRNEKLKLLGNGVVAQQAAYAMWVLLRAMAVARWGQPERVAS